ncbi:hypothetical protein EHQ24_00095 [Leptospira noumeaensis]|uniref:Endonuclease GajA/Old nuclease/RecF-like AAA domain-containing protein n=1 Tax=Leptospira noumeaensis TaxID=2484964 RepID=A0A4R9IJB3_9LEPT|nr:AAA family ATPase [Leptospira noumeaensis]TGK89253.1 hypothetical protein EHQ24_00095 [Leptospira noumeaensis]
MQIIQKIEIKNFRSFGNRKQEKTEINEIKKLNIFSGSNDSGKSNILRALNLFFNKKTNLNEFFVFENDYFQRVNRDDDDIKEELVTIKIWFNNTKNRNLNRQNRSEIKLPESFWVSRKWKKSSEYSTYDQDDGVKLAFQKEKGDFQKDFFDQKTMQLRSNIKASLSKQLTDYLDSVQYHYIPAIKDKEYFSHLYGELQQTLLKEKKSNVETNKSNFQKSIQDDTLILMQEFERVANNNFLNVQPVFELPNLINLFRTLKVQTGLVNLLFRGDGIQAKLIPEILNFISTKESSFTVKNIKSGEKAKKYFIWGYEEPENSFEYKNAQLLADRFKDTFTENAQIFLSTHSFNFLSLNGDNISKYRVWKDDSIESSRITKITYNKNGEVNFDTKDFRNDFYRLNEELGVFSLNNKLEEIFIETEKYKRILENKFKTIKKSENCLLVEDTYDQIYKIAWLKINNINCSEANYESLFEEKANFRVMGMEGAGSVSGFLRAKNVSIFKDNNIVGLFDFDKEGTENYSNLKKEKFWTAENSGDKNSCIFKKRTDHKSCYAMLIPVPANLTYLADIKHPNFSNFIEIENLLPENFLTENDLVEEMEILERKYYKIKDDKKKSLWKLLFNLESKHFSNFIPIFEKLEEWFG